MAKKKKNLLNKKTDLRVNSANDDNNVLPIDEIPNPLRDYIVSQSKQLNVSPVAILAPALSSLGVAIGNTRKLWVDGGHFEIPSLWTIVIAPPGGRKTACLKAGTAGIDLIQSQYIKENSDKRISVNDTSIFALNDTLKNNSRGLLWKIDEFDFLIHSIRDKIGNVLSYWTGEPIEVKRGNKKLFDPYVIPSGYVVGIATTTQPEVLLTQFARQAGLKNGFADRFLFCYATPQMSIAKKGRSPAPANDPNYNSYIELFNKFIQFEDEKVLELSDDAFEYYSFYQCTNQNLATEKNDTYLGKLDVHALRIALILELCKDSEAKEVSIETLKLSIKIVDWFNNCRLKLFNDILKSQKTKLEDKILTFLRKHPCVTANVIRNSLFSAKYRPERKAILQALKNLEEMRLIGYCDNGTKKTYAVIAENMDEKRIENGLDEVS